MNERESQHLAHMRAYYVLGITYFVSHLILTTTMYYTIHFIKEETEAQRN